LHLYPSIALALGGGGSKGNAHLGILRVLEREGIRVGAIAGSSMGGLVAAIFACGISPDEMEDRFSTMERSALFRRGPGVHNAIMGLDGVAAMLQDWIGDRRFEDLPIPVGMTAVDLITGQEIILTSGPILDAVLATIALPGVFPPRLLNGYELVDGGLINPVPVGVARSLAPHLPVVASVLTRPPESNRELPRTEVLGPMPLLQKVSRLRLAQAWEVFTRAIGISGRLLAELRLGIEKPDLIIRSEVDHIGMMDEVDVHEIAKLGEIAASRELPALRRLLAQRTSLYALLNRFSKRDRAAASDLPRAS